MRIKGYLGIGLMSCLFVVVIESEAEQKIEISLADTYELAYPSMHVISFLMVLTRRLIPCFPFFSQPLPS